MGTGNDRELIKLSPEAMKAIGLAVDSYLNGLDRGLPAASFWEPTSALSSLAQDIININRINGFNAAVLNDWDDDYKIPAILALITSETSEALEAFRNRDFENFKEECADQLIRILDLMGGMQMDIDGIVREKLEKNKTRGHKHGGKRI